MSQGTATAMLLIAVSLGGLAAVCYLLAALIVFVVNWKDRQS